MAVLGYLPKLERSLGLAVGAFSIRLAFSVWFFHKNVPYLILCQGIKFQCHTFFPFQDMKRNVLLSSYLDSWRCHKLEELPSINLEGSCWQGEKEEKMEIQKFGYL